jgi:hypothetical protein
MPRHIAKGFLVLLFGVCVYRAITQSIACDEGVTFELYIAGPIASIFHHYDANHHFLHTLLVRLSVAIFGVSELSMRLPALGGAVLYFTAVYRLARLVVGEGWKLVVAVAVLALNPLILDFMVAARGYGIALGLWMWALALLIEELSAKAPAARKLAIAGAALGLSVTANLVFIVPTVGLAGIAVCFLARRKSPEPEAPRKKRGPSKPARGWPPWIWFIGPVAAIALLFLMVAPVEDMRAEHFYAGASSLGESIMSLAAGSLQHSGPLRRDAWRLVSWIAGYAAAPLVLIAGLVVGFTKRNLALLLAAGPAVFAAAIAVILHLASGTPYPIDRTGIYFLPLVVFVLLGLAEAAPRIPGRALCAMAGLLIAIFISEFNMRKFLVWEYDADTRTMAEYIAAHRPQRADSEPVRVGGSWVFEPALFFYATKHQWTWMELRRTPQPEAGCEFCLLSDQDRPYIEKLGLREVYRGPVSGSVLAVPR